MPTTPTGTSPWTTLLPAVLLGGCAEFVQIPVEVPEEDPSREWSALLQQSITPRGVDYDRIDAERETLHSYLAWVGEHGPGLDEMKEGAEDERIAFMANAYNAFVIEGVLRHQPLRSVLDVGEGPWTIKPGSGFFVGQKFRIDGDWQSLYMLEQQDIIGRYQEPLVHVALNCASRGCPPLRWWSPRGMTGQLRRQMKTWLSRRGMQKTNSGYAVSEIFFWYEDDFLDWSSAENLCQYLLPFVSSADLNACMHEHSYVCPLYRTPYDWDLKRLDAGPGGARPAQHDGEAPVEVPAEPDEPEEELGAIDEDGQMEGQLRATAIAPRPHPG